MLLILLRYDNGLDFISDVFLILERLGNFGLASQFLTFYIFTHLFLQVIDKKSIILRPYEVFAPN